MANEITLTASLAFAKGSVSVSLSKSAAQFSVDAGSHKYYSGMQTVGTSEEALELGDIATGGYCLLINRDATNYVSVRAGTGAANLIKLKAGEAALFRCEAAAPYVIANTAACLVEVLLIEL